MDTKPACPGCGKLVVANAAKGLCPACLMKGAFPTATETGCKSPLFVPPTVAELAAKFSQLEILELVGQGGMGAVYKARQPRLNRYVALKILAPERESNPQFSERFEQEGRALARLNHPNIVAVHDFGDVGGHFYLLMEFVDGLNLRQMLRIGRISSREALAIVPQICDALQYAHDHGIVHRDIKPENILLDRRGRVKIADFGLAKLTGVRGNEPVAAGGVAVGGSSDLTDSGKIMGTPQYMAPEQRECPGEVDHRADIYALGVVFYQMLTGELPGEKIELPSSKVQIDVRLDEVVLRALEKKPELRYQQASALKTQIETIATQTGVANALPAEPVKASGSSSNEFAESITAVNDNRKKRAVILVPAFSLIACIVVAWFFFWKPTGLVAHVTGDRHAIQPRPPPPANPHPGLVALWSAENNGLDSVGKNDAELTDITFAASQAGRAFSFNGVSSTMRIPATPALNVGVGDGFTIEGWIDPATVNIEVPIFEYERVIGSQNANDVGVQLWISSYNGAGCLFANIVDTSHSSHMFTSSGGLVKAGAWQHVALTYDKRSGVAVIYLNGSPVATQALGSFTPLTSFNLFLGARTTFGSASNPKNDFPGRLDEFSLYNNALGAPEIRSVFAGKYAQAPAGLISWWAGEDNTVDSVGGNNGSLANTASFAPGQVGTGFRLDGSRGYVLINASSTLNAGQGDGFTLAGWINPTTVANEAPIAEYERVLGSYKGNDLGVEFWISSENSPGCLFANVRDTACADHILTTSAGLVHAGAWQHVALTYDKESGVAVLYLNGSQVASGNLGSFTPQTGFFLLLGARTTFSSASNPKYAFPGGLDEMALYGRALNSTEILQVYNIGSAAKWAQ